MLGQVAEKKSISGAWAILCSHQLMTICSRCTLKRKMWNILLSLRLKWKCRSKSQESQRTSKSLRTGVTIWQKHLRNMSQSTSIVQPRPSLHKYPQCRFSTRTESRKRGLSVNTLTISPYSERFSKHFSTVGSQLCPAAPTATSYIKWKKITW